MWCKDTTLPHHPYYTRCASFVTFCGKSLVSSILLHIFAALHREAESLRCISQDKQKYFARLLDMEESLLYTENLYQAMSDAYLDGCLHLVVLQGTATFELEDKTYHAQAHDCIIKPGASPITNIRTSQDFLMKGVIISNSYLRKNLPHTHYEVKGMMSMLENPILHMLSSDTARIVGDLEDLRRRWATPLHLFHAETMRRALELLILDLYDVHARMQQNTQQSYTQSHHILRKFITHLQTGMYRQNRQVEYYASLLNITAKYLSEACVAASGHNASFWIDRFTSQEIGRLLQDNRLTLQDIAYRFRFSSVNYLTRYVKRTLGMTPSAYRMQYNVAIEDNHLQ